jgi:hypothetical protein
MVATVLTSGFMSHSIFFTRVLFASSRSRFSQWCSADDCQSSATVAVSPHLHFYVADHTTDFVEPVWHCSSLSAINCALDWTTGAGLNLFARGIQSMPRSATIRSCVFAASSFVL